MFVIRRDSDGKYWRNVDFHKYCSVRFRDSYDESILWTDHVHEVKPFKSRGAAKNSRGGPGMKKVAVDKPGGLPGAFYGNYKWVPRTWEEAGKEVVEVTVVIKPPY